MVLKYYYDLLSEPSRALYIFLNKTGIPFERCPVKIIAGEHLTESFKQKYSKFQKLPFIHDGDFRLQESVAILRYLAKKYPIEDHWYSKDDKKQAKEDEYLEWHHLNVRLNCSRYFSVKWRTPFFTGREASEDKVKLAKNHMMKTLGEFEELFLSDGRFINGDTISFADIQAACEIEQPRIAGFDARNYFPKIKIWIESVKKECNPFYDEAHQPLIQLIQNEEMQAKL